MPKSENTSQFTHRASEFSEFILEGASKTLLAKMFALSRPTVQKYLTGVAPDGYRGKTPIYKVARVAPLLMRVGLNAETGQDVNDPDTMTPDKRKDFWDAKMKEQKAMEAAGDLWPTEQVIALAADAFKHIKFGTVLFADTVARETELTNKQREIILALSDSLLDDLHKRLINDLRDEFGAEVQES